MSKKDETMANLSKHIKNLIKVSMEQLMKDKIIVVEYVQVEVDKTGPGTEQFQVKISFSTQLRPTPPSS